MKWICLVLVVLSIGCENAVEQDMPTLSDIANKDIDSTNSNNNLKMSYSIKNALEFIGVPQERLEKLTKSVEGKLLDERQFAFSLTLFYSCQNKDVNKFKTLLSDGTKNALNEGDIYNSVVAAIKNIEQGTFILCEDRKFFVTIKDFSKQNRLGLEFPDKPTNIFIFYRYYGPKELLAGAQIYFIEDRNSFKIVFPTRQMHRDLNTTE